MASNDLMGNIMCSISIVNLLKSSTDFKPTTIFLVMNIFQRNPFCTRIFLYVHANHNHFGITVLWECNVYFFVF